MKKVDWLLVAWGVALLVSAVQPYDYVTWFLEVLPVLIAVPLLWISKRRFPLTNLLLLLIFIHGLILILGAHYTYARVPLGFWIQDLFDLSRNPYDRIGHLAQGFVPAILAREILIRRAVVTSRRWLIFLVTSVCLAFSAFYELIEWWVALMSEEAAESFLGTQGDVWDTQWDMFLALCGALLAQFSLSSYHDNQINQLTIK